MHSTRSKDINQKTGINTRLRNLFLLIGLNTVHSKQKQPTHGTFLNVFHKIQLAKLLRTNYLVVHVQDANLKYTF